MWTLDPIDGTKGFLRGGQYAIGLALIVDSKVQFGIMGCPNVPVSPTDPDGERGCIFMATRGQGAHQVWNAFSLAVDLTLAKAVT
jgi:3'(2'), 5'-bisphosphate nucleotidase